MIGVCGAGAVGLALGARLARAGLPVLFIVRREEVARAIREQGVCVTDPGEGSAWLAKAEAVTGPAAAAARLGEGPVLFATRGADLAAAAEALQRALPEAAVACLLNDVHHEELLARRFARVIGVVVRQTTTRSGDRDVTATGSGRLVLGSHPEGVGTECLELAGALRQAGYDVGLSRCIGEDKWLKLCVNLMSAPNALIRRSDHETPAFVELKARLLEEARETLRAAGIVARSCDGRDRSLDEEIRWQRESLARGLSARKLPIYNQVWQALRRGGPLEANGYHRRILDLAEAHGVPTPQNRRVLAALESAARHGRGPECLGAAELLGTSP